MKHTMFNYLKILQKRKEWRKLNPHNSTTIKNIVDFDCVKVGNNTYGELHILCFNKEYKLSIGNYCSISSGTVFALSSEHAVGRISTFPFKSKALNKLETEGLSKGDIVVSDDVWIGENSIILSGVTIGQGAVIGAGAVVTKDVPPYAIAVGVPARVIKYRFNDSTIAELTKIDYSKLSIKDIEEHQKELYSDLTDVNQIEWLPKKQ